MDPANQHTAKTAKITICLFWAIGNFISHCRHQTLHEMCVRCSRDLKKGLIELSVPFSYNTSSFDATTLAKAPSIKARSMVVANLMYTLLCICDGTSCNSLWNSPVQFVILLWDSDNLNSSSATTSYLSCFALVIAWDSVQVSLTVVGTLAAHHRYRSNTFWAGRENIC